DLAHYPAQDLLRVLATLLHQIATANDELRPNGQAASRSSNVRAERPSITTASLGALGTPSSTLCFHARNVPSISIESYLLRILKYCPTTNEVFLSLLVYFDRMSRMGLEERAGDAEPHPGMRGFAIDSYNVHRLVIAGVTVASKFFSDVFYTNSRYAKVGGLPVHELNQLELQFLLLNDFRLVVPLEEMQR
ncbi:cyclin-related 2, partial [Tilletiopsis washingtonensis]